MSATDYGPGVLVGKSLVEIKEERLQAAMAYALSLTQCIADRLSEDSEHIITLHDAVLRRTKRTNEVNRELRTIKQKLDLHEEFSKRRHVTGPQDIHYQDQLLIIGKDPKDSQISTVQGVEVCFINEDSNATDQKIYLNGPKHKPRDFTLNSYLEGNSWVKSVELII